MMDGRKGDNKAMASKLSKKIERGWGKMKERKRKKEQVRERESKSEKERDRSHLNARAVLFLIYGPYDPVSALQGSHFRGASHAAAAAIG